MTHQQPDDDEEHTTMELYALTTANLELAEYLCHTMRVTGGAVSLSTGPFSAVDFATGQELVWVLTFDGRCRDVLRQLAEDVDGHLDAEGVVWAGCVEVARVVTIRSADMPRAWRGRA